MPNPFDDKRQAARLGMHVPLRYQLRGSAEFSNTVSSNISSGGISFVVERFLPPDTDVMLEIKLLSRIVRPIGRIKWSSPLAHSDRYQSGAAFLEFDPQDHHYYRDYLGLIQPKV